MLIATQVIYFRNNKWDVAAWFVGVPDWKPREEPVPAWTKDGFDVFKFKGESELAGWRLEAFVLIFSNQPTKKMKLWDVLLGVAFQAEPWHQKAHKLEYLLSSNGCFNVVTVLRSGRIRSVKADNCAPAPPFPRFEWNGLSPKNKGFLESLVCVSNDPHKIYLAGHWVNDCDRWTIPWQLLIAHSQEWMTYLPIQDFLKLNYQRVDLPPLLPWGPLVCGKTKVLMIMHNWDAQSLYVWWVRHTLWHNQKLETCKSWSTTQSDN
jgi:hypothetical protein